MTPPRVCPQPGPRAAGPDCPLLTYTKYEQLRRAILTERARLNLGDLVWADFNRQYQRPEAAPPTRPVLPRPDEPLPLPIPGHLQRSHP